MTSIGLAQIAIVLLAVIVAAVPLGDYIARVLAGERSLLSPALSPIERVFYRLAGVDPAREQNWLAYTMAMLAFSVVGFASLYALQRLQAYLPLNPQGFERRSRRSRLQHVDELRHQHQLAELRRRVDDEPLDADARPHRAQFRIRRDRPCDGVCAGARLLARRIADDRQFLGRPHALDALRAPADLDRRRARARRSRRAADASRFDRSDDARGREADARHRPGREPRGDQGTRHQWRRLLQRQFRASLREPERAFQHAGDLGAARHPLRARRSPLDVRSSTIDKVARSPSP